MSILAKPLHAVWKSVANHLTQCSFIIMRDVPIPNFLPILILILYVSFVDSDSSMYLLFFDIGSLIVCFI